MSAAFIAVPSAPVTDPAALVNPFIGTGSGGPVVGDVDAFPGATVPFGMVQWSPDTPSRPSGGGYRYDDHDITGFSLTHLSGVGCPTGGDLPFLPSVGDAGSPLPFSHSDESASPGRYSVTAGGIGVALAAGPRTGVGAFTYPRTDSARLLVKVAGSQNGSANTTFAAVGDREVTGSVTSGRFCGQPNAYTVYFAAVFDRPFTNVADTVVTFDTRTNPVVRVKVALSYVDVAGAEANLRAEARTFDVATVAAAARRSWNRMLGRIRISGGTDEQRTQFYTALYHTMLGPNLFSDADGRYRGFDGQVHRATRPQYANFSGWDVYRSEIPLLALVAPEETSDMMASLLRNADEGGWLPKWPVANGYTDVMNGDAADPILAGAYAFGARGFDARHALDLMVRGAEADGPPGQGWYVERPSRVPYLERGYVPNARSTSISPVPNGASETLEYAVDDFAIGRLAGAVGRPGVAARFHARSQNWANLFDTATGYIRPRDADGAFPPGAPVTTAGFGQSGFQEGNAAQYTWMVPQNLRALADGIGGDAAAAARLDSYFTKLNAGPNEPFHWQGNEPTFGTPWAYNTFRQPWKTQATVRRIMTELYHATPGGEPGNDDVGALSSWYVWAALGLYPQTPGVPLLVVGSPLFPHAEIDAGPGRRIVIDAPGAAADRPYVHALRVNGRPTGHTWLTLRDRGTTRLDFTLAATPDTHWGTGRDDAPPSFGAGPVRFPPTTRAFVTEKPGQVKLTPGRPSTVDIVVDNTLGTAPATVTWKATGLVVTPGSATVTAAPGGSVATTVTVSAAPDLPSGYYQVDVRATAAGGAVIQTTHLLATVTRPGETIPTAYVSNYSDGTVTPVDTRTHNAGPAIPVGSGPDGVVVTPDNSEVYIANNNSNSVTVLSTVDNHVVATVPVGSIAADVDITPDDRTAWVSNYGDGTVQPIDTATHTAGAPVTVGANPQRLRIQPGGARLWVPNQGSGTVSVVDLAGRTVAGTVTVGAAPFGIAFSPDGRTAYVGNTGGNSLSIVDTSTLAVTRTVALGTSPAGLAMAPDGHVLYMTVASGGVLPVDPATGTVGALIATGAGTYDVEFAPDGSTAWVVDTNANDVRPVDVPAGTAGGAVVVGNVPDGVGLTKR
jgi:predicted alpha-1,2-mannosidase